MSLKCYHEIWLAAHPCRDENWLRRMLADGFHIHHIDGNHDNNSSNNLVLIEGSDHMMIHNGQTRRIEFIKYSKKERRRKRLWVTPCRKFYLKLHRHENVRSLIVDFNADKRFYSSRLKSIDSMNLREKIHYGVE